MSTTEMRQAILDEWRTLRAEHSELEAVSIRFSKRMTRTLGSCRFRRDRLDRFAPAKCFEVVISESLLACGLEQVTDTLRHEAAHAIAGLEAQHGPVWKAVARSIGCSATRCGELTDEQREARAAAQSPAKYTIRCAKCGIKDDRRSMKTSTKRTFNLGMASHGAGCGGLLELTQNY